MSKKRKLILIILGLIIIGLIIGIILVNNRPKNNIKIVTEKEFIDNYNSFNKNNDNIVPLKNHLHKKETKKDTYLFENKYYLVIGRKDEKLDKVYLYAPKDSKYKDYLLMMIKSINPNLNTEEALNIFNKMTDIKDKKADEVGFLINFKEDGYNYITMEKGNGKDLSFFIYQPQE